MSPQTMTTHYSNVRHDIKEFFNFSQNILHRISSEVCLHILEMKILEEETNATDYYAHMDTPNFTTFCSMNSCDICASYFVMYVTNDTVRILHHSKD